MTVRVLAVSSGAGCTTETHQFLILLCIPDGAVVIGKDLMEDGGDDQRSNTEGEQGRRRLRHGDIEELFLSIKATGEEGHAQHK